MTIQDGGIAPVARTWSSRGLTLHYLDWGTAAAPPLVLLHGLRDHARAWDGVAQALRADWHVMAVDLRGHGDSDWSPDGAYLNPFHVHDLADLIDSLGHAQVTLIGHSFGGGIAARYAAMFPDRVRKLVIADGMGPSATARAGWEAQGAVQRTREWIDRLRAAAPPRRLASIDEAAQRLMAANKRLSETQARHLATHGVRRSGDGYAWKYDPLIGNFLPEDFAVDSAHFWRAITAPTLLLYGTASWTSNPETDGRAAHFRDHKTVVFENIGHWLHHEDLDGVLAALRDFL